MAAVANAKPIGQRTNRMVMGTPAAMMTFHQFADLWRYTSQAIRRQKGLCQAGCKARSIATGTWSDGFSQPRTCFSIEAEEKRSAACGDSSTWSMRMPLFLCQAPA